MVIEVDNSNNELAIFANRQGNYLAYKNKPITVTWNYYYTDEETNRFFAILPHNKEYRNKINAILPNDTNIDFSNNIQGLYDFLKPLWKILKNGNYKLQFYKDSKELFKRRITFSDDELRNYYDPLEIAFANDTTNIAKLNLVQSQYKIKWRKGEHINERNLEEILRNTTSFDYDEDMLYFHSTLPKNEIDLDRVAYYETEIKNGKRPFAILINSSSHHIDLLPSYYILDGHHKLLAYKNLKIYPPLSICTYTENTIFDLEELALVLYPWHIEYIIENQEWQDKRLFLEKVTSNKSSNLYPFIKNGKFEDYDSNRNKKYEINYKDSLLDGEQKTWYYDNGQLESIRYYHRGRAIGTWKSYFKSGQIQSIQPFNNKHQAHGIIVSYHENGQKCSEREYKNDRHKDGVYYTWHKNGLKEFEVTYKNAKIVEQKSWDYLGTRHSHRRINKESGLLEDVENIQERIEVDNIQKEYQTIIQIIKKYLNRKLKK